ncbi:MAG: phosphoribosylamine--glycine ligase [Candidatus Omnitrophica bacterium]|jgi:phosphoribosylamine--glycine ligase|nr:phosphoribosylamine--glycine ligase [Candidatus Omnitrophota bacterium]
MRVLVIGSGGREHCLAWKISQSSRVDKIYCAPGNGGISLIAENVNISATDIKGLLEFAIKNNIDLTVVGPETPLVAGIVDEFELEGLPVFGPSKDLALLEGSKVFAKELMHKYGIPTADFKVFDDARQAKEYIANKKMPLVVKADGLAAGKGVMVCGSLKEAQQAIDAIMVEKQFKDAGRKVVIEDYLKGEEVSLLAFIDGKTVIPLVSSQDYKRIYDKDKGPNTGGMGAYSPVPLVNKSISDVIREKIFIPLINGLYQEGKIYKGILYAGLMVKDNEPYVLEFNTRFGDPETQVILPKLESDLVDIMVKTIEGNLEEVELKWDKKFSLGVVLASGGYPGNYEKDKIIKGLDNLDGSKKIFTFHAGTRIQNGNFVTDGGRVLNIVGLGDTIKQARDNVYSAINNIEFEGMYYRKDIGSKLL